jgi:hypothetical protein
MYSIYLGAEAYSELNASIEVYLDGITIGDTIDLRSGGTQNKPFTQIKLGEVDIITSEDHVVEIETSDPGRFLWDYILFKPK